LRSLGGLDGLGCTNRTGSLELHVHILNCVHLKVVAISIGLRIRSQWDIHYLNIGLRLLNLFFIFVIVTNERLNFILNHLLVGGKLLALVIISGHSEAKGSSS